MVAKNLRLSDLANRGRHGALKLLSVRLPVQLIERVDDLVQRLGSGKAEVVVALLNEGLDKFERARVSRRKRQAA
jgi:predicted DNA-binding protein